MFKKILIANRGEIACRIIRTARRMGVATVAVYSDADAGSMHVAMADEAVRIGPAPVTESYLVGERIVAAALETGAEAIHPGYGFLSENPDFVDRVVDAGLVFIGPSAASIRAMGLKDAAKRLMEKAGVPVVPGYHGEAQDIVLLASKATEIGYPVLIKARAGGGGRGMRRVDHPGDFAEALSSARREAKAAFGDDRVLVEKYVEKPRHIEVQVFGDNHGNAVHLFERDCSAQRRHQKVIEEAPAPGMTDEMRAAMTEAAIKAAKAIAYSGAGTIEFIVDASQGLKVDRFWFMEMNTRLQVEHPVTEMITGVDLVEWQLRVAHGEVLPLRQDEIELDGHAFEARLYAEDAARGFLPATGTLHHLWFPDEAAPGTSLRVETGVREGDTISPFYDPMIAKLVVHGPDRKTALDGLGDMLAETEIAGSTVNTAFLAALAADPDFASGDVDTGLIGRKQDELTAIPAPAGAVVAAAVVAVSGLSDMADAGDPWSALTGYAHFHATPRRITLGYGEEVVRAKVGVEAGRTFVELDELNGETLRLRPSAINLARWPGHVSVFDGPVSYTFAVPDPLDRADEAGSGADSLRAPMPGLVKVVRAAAGDSVTKGQPLLILEAMKMEHSIAAPHDGVIVEIATEGSQVSDGTVLVRFAEQAGE
ncbi:acetyl/propionyl/methylcrotonyl-CoA carboxylase subunit alpha [Aquamicrobium sp. NLF2-7]|uniref:acetyl-CoA carboxylase biotin carboxylase subunit n=1 Tax=Aquamicrobium sp. NLF2-7 TaxID=2918753 RepID=UPI001EFB16EC|nr:acetyl/propionyl/methylcrotonyl-CoA carboxylase subunit alpha [Aquamicrobium sp. NLF2-7]MCG8269924.1 acetyl/propionyl/methylcrotonyl-CoA carboxylase subunit alpha [Aquamicrobium sp. NLF2-7]